MTADKNWIVRKQEVMVYELPLPSDVRKLERMLRELFDHNRGVYEFWRVEASPAGAMLRVHVIVNDSGPL